jgi:cyanophycinase-like exopeptidase
MPQVNVIRWRDGQGWIVLSGGDRTLEDTSDIEAQAMTRIGLGEPVAYLWAAGDIESADRHLEVLSDLGAPTGYLVDVLTEDDATISRQIAEAGMVILGDGPNLEQLRMATVGAALEGMNQSFARGGVIMGIGAGAALLGSFLEGAAGLGWVEGAVIIPRHDDADQAARLHSLLAAHPGAYGLGIGAGSALALGPNGEVEAWGRRQITVTLGHSIA